MSTATLTPFKHILEHLPLSLRMTLDQLDPEYGAGAGGDSSEV